MNKLLLSAALLTASGMVYAQDYVTPADLSEQASDKMYSILTEYNKCMMQSHLQSLPELESGQAAAEQIMQNCETHLDNLKAHLAENNVEPDLIEGMSKTMRSRAARQLMAKTMNNLAAQAQAASHADKMKQEAAAE
ncbi:MAG: hypothetical protein Kow0083_02590 [Methylophaga sp.]|jgi:hypothetical protein